MSDFDISESKDEELVLLLPQHLVIYQAQSDEDALAITKLAKRICRKRWPKAYIKIFNGKNYCLDEEEFSEFILIQYGSRVEDDADMEIWSDRGAFIRQDVADKIVAEAMASAGKVPSAALRKRKSLRRANAAKAKGQKKTKLSPPRENKMTLKERIGIADRQKARWAAIKRKIGP